VDRTCLRPSRSQWIIACCCFVVLLLAGALRIEAAEDEGYREYDFYLTKGILLFSQDRYGEAERYLREALNAKPDDVTAGYYLGLTLLRLHRYPAAEERFRAILRRHPDNARARLGLGMALYHQDRFSEASAELATAERTLKDEPLLYYYAGLAAASQQAYEQASAKFLQAGKLDKELADDPHYQRGVALQSKGQAQPATDEFRLAVEGGAVAAQPIRPPVSTTLPSKRWSLNYGLSTQYDSNVVLLPGGGTLPNGISHKDDFVFVLTGNGEYRFVQNDTWTAGVGLGLYTNFHARLSDFNVVDVGPTVYVQRRLGVTQLRFQYTFDNVTVGGDSYLQSNAFQPTLTIPESDRTFTQVFARYQYKNFKTFRDDQFARPINQTRDGINWMFGAMQYWRFADDRGHLRAGYTLDLDRTGGGDTAQFGVPTNGDWSYTGHRLSFGGGYRPFTATTLQLAFDYYRQSYENANSFSPDLEKRKDNVYLLTGTAVRDLNSWLWLAFQYSYTRDQSNVAVFDYTRHIVSLTLGGAF
jgi:tetratricopeptide (TPR) repeat protein